MADGVSWIVLARGHSKIHRRPGEWVVLYGDNWGQDRQWYYTPYSTNQVEPYLEKIVADMVVGEKRRLWVPAGASRAKAFVRDIELAAVLGAAAPPRPVFPVPSDARVGSSGLRSVVLASGKGPRPARTDRVYFSVTAFAPDGGSAVQPQPLGTMVLEDVPIKPLAAALLELTAGEERWFWVPAAQHHGTAVVWRILLYSVEQQPQVAPPADLASPPGAGVTFKILTAGDTDPPPALPDEVIASVTGWTRSGRTIQTTTGLTTTVDYYPPAVASQMTAMHVGEKRRIWIPATSAQSGAAEVWDVELTAIHRKLDPLPGGLELVVDHRMLEVRKGKQRADLTGASGIQEARLDRKTATVIVEYFDPCSFTRTGSWSLVRLEAMLEVADARALKRKRDDKGAAAAFARAAALDPTWIEPVYGRAAALLRAGDAGAAAGALAGLLATAPIATYLRVATDPELSGLSARAELQAVRAKSPGTVVVTSAGIAGTIAISPDRRQLAVTFTDESGGGGVSSGFALEVRVLDLPTGRVVSTLPIVSLDETDRNCYDDKCDPILATAHQAIDRRARALQARLRELGFVPAKIEGAKAQPDSSQAPARYTGRLARAKLGLEEQGGMLQIVQLPSSAKLAAASIPNTRVDAVVYVEDTRTIVIWSSDLQSEAGCNEDRHPNVTAIAVPPIAVPPIAVPPGNRPKP